MPHAVTLTIWLLVVDAAILSFTENATTLKITGLTKATSPVEPNVSASVLQAMKTDAPSAEATAARYNTISDAPGPTVFVLTLEETGLQWVHTGRS